MPSEGIASLFGSLGVWEVYFAQPRMPNRQRVQVSALRLANVRVLGNIRLLSEAVFSHFQKGGNFSPCFQEVVVMRWCMNSSRHIARA